MVVTIVGGLVVLVVWEFVGPGVRRGAQAVLPGLAATEQQAKQTAGGQQQTSKPAATKNAPAGQTAGPFRDHLKTPVVGSGQLRQGTYSDGMATYSDADLSSHLNIQRVRLEENPDGCAIAFLNAQKVWFGSSQRTALTINGSVVGELFGVNGRQGYMFDLPINRGDKICVTDFNAAGFHLIFGPDVYYHYDSYCYRGNC